MQVAFGEAREPAITLVVAGEPLGLREATWLLEPFGRERLDPPRLVLRAAFARASGAFVRSAFLAASSHVLIESFEDGETAERGTRRWERAPE